MTALPSTGYDSEVTTKYNGGFERGLAAAKYTPILPSFSPSDGYLNFEVAVELSDSGKTRFPASLVLIHLSKFIYLSSCFLPQPFFQACLNILNRTVESRSPPKQTRTRPVRYTTQFTIIREMSMPPFHE